MGISTKNVGNAGLSKKDKIAALQKEHEAKFKALGLENPHYVPKVCYGEPLVMPFFESELRVNKDVYTEKVSRDYISEDPTRTLYVWKHNPDWKNMYNTKPFGHNPNDVMYLIPFTEFKPVTKPKKKLDFGLINTDEDCNLQDATLRDLAAILLEAPVSRKDWLNEIINKKNNG